MQEPYLEVTFRHGRALAAYYYLPRATDDRAARSEPAQPGLVVDYAEDGRPVGIEITSPRRVTLEVLNAVLAQLGVQPVGASEFAPLHAA